MEPESSLPQPQLPANCPYPEPAPSSPHNPLPLPEDPPIYVWVSLTVCAHLSPPPYAPHAQPISFFSILPPAQYWVRSSDQDITTMLGIMVTSLTLPTSSQIYERYEINIC
jgi:hypothetical protein